MSKKVGNVVIHTFYKYVEEPDEEDFDEIYHVQPVLVFEDESEEKFLKLKL